MLRFDNAVNIIIILLLQMRT